MTCPTVLLSGELNAGVLSEALRDMKRIASAGAERCTIVIDSDGGHPREAVEFVRGVKRLGLRHDVKIYNAHSAAAYIALALRDNSEVSQSAVIGFHRGSIQVEATLLHLGQIPKVIEEAITVYMNELDALVLPYIRSDPFLAADFFGSGWVRIKAEECVRMGIFHSTF